MRSFFAVACCLIFLPVAAVAQGSPSNEIGLMLGVEFIPDQRAGGQNIGIGNSEVFQVSFARCLAEAPAVALFFEVPAVAAPSHRIKSALDTPVSLATFFLTPGFRAAFRPDNSFSPWLSFGGGYALYEGSELVRSGAVNARRFTSTAALQFGGGFDIETGKRLIVPIRLRAEVRDFYSLDTLRFNVPLDSNRQHNVVVSGGFVLRW